MDAIPLAEKDWDELIGFIREEFLIKNRGIKDVYQSVQQRHPQVTYTQFRAKLKEWGFRKNLTPTDWRYIDHSMKERESHQKQSVVIYSGIRLDEEKVRKQLNRNKDITLSKKYGLSRVPEPPKEDALYVCTPRAVSPAAVEWPESLPWLQFDKFIFPELLRGLRFLSERETGMAITISPTQHSRPRKRFRPNPSLAWSAFEALVHRSMKIVIGSEELTKTLLSSRSIDRIACHLDRLIPTTYTNENLTRAMLLSDGKAHEVQREVLKIMLFLASNHLIMDTIKDIYTDKMRYIDDARALMDICRYSGLTEPHVLAKIVNVSFRCPTLVAIIDLLYEAAVSTEATDIVDVLLKVDRRLEPDRLVRLLWLEGGYIPKRLSALQFAILRSSLELAGCMLQNGADANYAGEKNISPLGLAARNCPSGASSQFIPLLLRYGAAINEEHGPVALYIAIRRGSFNMIDQLHEGGADFTKSCSSSYFRGYSTDQKPLILQHRIEVLNLFSDVTSLGLAAAFKGDIFHLPENLSSGEFSPEETVQDYERIHDEEAALQLVKHIISLAGPTFDLDGRIKSDAVIHAASRGYAEVILFLLEIGARVDAKNGFLCPIYAAVSGAHVETYRQLLRLGCLPLAERRSKNNGIKTISAQISPLNIAICAESYSLVRLLIEGGVDVNLPDQINELLHWGLPQSCPRDVRMLGSKESPLNVATAYGYSDVALLLLDMGAAATWDDFIRAASSGPPGLVTRILDRLQNSEVESIDDQLHELIGERPEKCVLNILDSTLPIDCEKALGLAVEYGRPNIVAKLIRRGTRLTVPQLIWAFRTLDESILQASLKSLAVIPTMERNYGGTTLLENAILSGNIDVINLALSLEPPAYDSGALCAVVLGTARSIIGMEEILQRILQKRESDDQQVPCFDAVLENTAIGIAAYYRRPDIIVKLQKYGNHEINAAVLIDHDWLDLLKSIMSGHNNGILPHGYNWHHPDRCLVSPIFDAVRSRSEPVVEKFLGMRYRPDARSLKAAIYHNVPFSLISRLIKECADINAGELIWMAAKSGRLDLVKEMLDNRAQINEISWHWRNAILNVVIQSRMFDMVDFLLRNGIDINGTPRLRYKGETALEVASQIGHLGVMRRLLECGADPNTTAVRERSAIEVAASYGRLDAVRLLLEYGVVKEGRGQLHYILAVQSATQDGYSAIVQLLKCYYSWTDKDEKILHYLEQHYKHPPSITAVIDHGQDTEEEIAELFAYLDELHREILVGETGPGMACKLMSWRPIDKEQAKKEKREIIARHRGILDMNTYIATPETRGRDDDTAISSTTDSAQQESGLVKLDEGNVLHGALPEDVGLLAANSRLEDEGYDCGNTSSGLQPHRMAEEDRMRHAVLRDLLGEEEIPFEPVEQPW